MDMWILTQCTNFLHPQAMLNAVRQLEEVVEVLPFMLATILSEKLVVMNIINVQRGQ